MSNIQFDVHVSNGSAMDVGNDELPIWWMEVHVYPFHFNQSVSLFHAEIKARVGIGSAR